MAGCQARRSSCRDAAGAGVVRVLMVRCTRPSPVWGGDEEELEADPFREIARTAPMHPRQTTRVVRPQPMTPIGPTECGSVGTHSIHHRGGRHMPRGDGTGPMGEGPMTGRGAGLCAGNVQPGF